MKFQILSSFTNALETVKQNSSTKSLFISKIQNYILAIQFTSLCTKTLMIFGIKYSTTKLQFKVDN